MNKYNILLLVTITLALQACSPNRKEINDPQSGEYSELTFRSTDSSIENFQSCKLAEEALHKYLHIKLNALYKDQIVSFDNTTEYAQPMAGLANREQADQINYTTTNNQVAGVDEGDFVKTDGKFIYHIDGKVLRIFKSSPAAETKMLSKMNLPGTPQTMVLNGDKLVVVSTISPEPVYYLGADKLSTKSLMPYSRPITVLTVVNLTDRSLPAIEKNLSYLGEYKDLRMTENSVRLILTNNYISYPKSISIYVDQWEHTNNKKLTREQFISDLSTQYEANHQAVNELSISTYLGFEEFKNFATKTGLDLQLNLGDCSSLYIPSYYADEGATKIVSYNLKTNVQQQAIILGKTDEIYMNTKSIYLASQKSLWETPDHSTNYTVIHKIDVSDQNQSRYLASGLVPGRILNQFSMDEYNNILRVATTVDTYERISTANLNAPWWSVIGRVKRYNEVYTLDVNQNRLNVLGQSGPLAEGESIQSVRFFNEKAFVVTFLRKDPLFTLNLSNPAQPEVVGELKVPGFSTYIHMYDENHLLAAGFETDESGITTGLKLSLFDVSDMKNPKELVTQLLGQGWSNVNYDHKAFTFVREKGILAIPVQSYNSNLGSRANNELRVFKVDLNKGFEQLGAVKFPESFGNSIERSIFIEDDIYAISRAAMSKTSLNFLNQTPQLINFEN